MLERPEEINAIKDDNARGQTSQVWNPQEGKALTLGTLQLTLKATGTETGGHFSLVEVTVPPYFSDIWPHFHQESSKAIYLIRGMLAVTLGEETMVVRQGSVILVPPKQVHRFWNPAATPATFLIYFTPAGAEGFYEALARTGLLDDEAAQPAVIAEIWALAMNFDHYPAKP